MSCCKKDKAPAETAAPREEVKAAPASESVRASRECCEPPKQEAKGCGCNC